MGSWSEVEAQAPELAAFARERFDAVVHKTIATLRRDGSPRISGTEVKFAEGELWIGSMAKALKALDLRRDPRYALHSGSADPEGGGMPGDAKLAGRAEEISDRARIESVYGAELAAGDSHVFRLDVSELVSIRVDDAGEKLLVDSWHEGRGTTRHER